MSTTRPELLVLLSLLASFSFCLYYNLQELIGKEKKGQAMSRKTVFLLHLLSYSFLVVSVILDIWALSFGPVSLKAPLGALNIVLSPLIARIVSALYYKTALDRGPIPHAANMGFVVLGCICCVAAEINGIEKLTAENIRSNWNSGGVIAYVTLECVLVVFFTMYICHSPFKRGYFIVAALYSSLLTLLLSTVIGLGSLAMEFELGLLITFILVFAILNLYHFSKGSSEIEEGKEEGKEEDVDVLLINVKKVDPNEWRNMTYFTSINIVVNVFNGIVVNQEYKNQTPMEILLFTFGIIVAVVTLVFF